MSLVKTIVRSSTGLFALAILFSVAVSGFGQSRDINNPTPIATFPVTGTLGSGTYYYQIPEAMVAAGRANVILDLTPPDGGASITVTLSGRRCCPPEAYIGVTTGLADRLRESTSFEVPGQQPLLVTVYISVAAKHTVSYRINFNLGTPTSGIIVTPPPPPPVTSPPGCTDLGVGGFSVTSMGLLRNKITGDVYNITTTQPYRGFPRRQWVEVRDITNSETRPRVVGRIFLPDVIEPGRSVPYGIGDTVPERGRRRYEVRIGYSHLNATDVSVYNDDCNARNNITRRQLVGPFPVEDDTLIELEQLPKRKP